MYYDALNLLAKKRREKGLPSTFRYSQHKTAAKTNPKSHKRQVTDSLVFTSHVHIYHIDFKAL